MKIDNDYIHKRVEDILVIKELDWFPYNIRCMLINLREVLLDDAYTSSNVIRKAMLVGFLNNVLLYALGYINDVDMMIAWKKYISENKKYIRANIYSPISIKFVNSIRNHPALRYCRLLPVK